MSLQLDCGIHPGLEGMDALPYIDLIDPAEIDLLLISQWVPFSKWKRSSHWYLTICLSPLFLCQFSFGSLRSLAMVFTEDKFQREDFYDPCHQSHLPLAAFRLCESQVHQRSTFNKMALSILEPVLIYCMISLIVKQHLSGWNAVHRDWSRRKHGQDWDHRLPWSERGGRHQVLVLPRRSCFGSSHVHDWDCRSEGRCSYFVQMFSVTLMC